MRRRLPDIVILVLLFALPLVMFWEQTVGGRTLLPAENLYQFEPYASYRDAAGAPSIPHNALLSDLVLQNMQFKWFIRHSIAQGEFPLWNPYQFSGIPFFAAGQQSTLYPFSAIFYVLPLTAAYGWFTVVQLWLAGVFMYAFVRGLGVSRAGASVSGIVYQLSAFFVISVVFPMILAAAVWLPLILLMTEYVIRQQPALKNRPASLPWVAIGAAALGCNVLAGHVEITYYTLIITAYYAAARLLVEFFRQRRAGDHTGSPLRWVVIRGLWLVAMITLGLGLGAVQFLPLFEAAGRNFRSGSASFDQVLGWAHPLRDVIQFVLPNFYGNPSHHAYFDVFTGQMTPAAVNTLGQPISTIDWGIKNYVEGALYLGILPLILSVVAVVSPHPKSLSLREGGQGGEGYRAIFALLALVSLTFMFGLPTYALLYYTLPGIDQLHSPFRWIFAVTLSVAALAGFGMDVLSRPHPFTPPQRAEEGTGVGIKRLGCALMAFGGLILVGLALSRVFYAQIAPLVERIFMGMAKAPDAFADARMFYSYQFTNVLTFGVFTLAAGIVIRLSQSPPHPNPSPPKVGEGQKFPLSPRVWERKAGGEGFKIPLWQILAVIVVAADLMVASWRFNPSSDPALLDYTPPAIAWLQAQSGDWRYTTLDDPSQPPLMNANLGMRYKLRDVRGYESIFSKQYVDYLQDHLAPQVQLDYNRVAPLYTAYPAGIDYDYRDALQSMLFASQTPYQDALNLLNVRYLITHRTTDIAANPRWTLVYEDRAVRIWENLEVLPRAYTVPESSLGDDPALPVYPAVLTGVQPATITHDSGRELLVELALDQPAGWFVLSETYAPGWRAFIRPQGAGEDAEQPLDVQLVSGNFIGARLPDFQGGWTIRLVYSPQSFQLGLFASFISAVLIVFALGVWVWRLFVGSPDDEAASVQRIARNSIAPILLNLFNRGIDFAFAAIMLRLLGPEQAGLYFYAVFIFGWFDIFTNFGLNLFLTREVARQRDKARLYLLNTSVLRLILAGIGVPLVLAFLGIRQSAVAPPLAGEALLAIGLLYVGLVPNSLSTGLSALLYAFERAEVPAAVTTIATISKTLLGLAVLVLGFGIVGLAGASIITNLLTLAVLWWNGRGLIHPAPVSTPRIRGVDGGGVSSSLLRRMVGESYPLMFNHFLASIFFQIDVVLIEAMHGAVMVGQYSVAYKWVAALNIIPSFFTQALLPVMSRQAHEDSDALKRTYTLAIKLLVSAALPTAVVFTFLAYALTGVLGGAEYLPDGAIATQLMIWSIPIGWMNSLTQYMLIALDLQRKITRAFILGVSFNIIANLILIPPYGYRAAALTTIASEAMLWIPFVLLLQSALGRLNWIEMVWRQVTAAGLMIGVLLLVWQTQPLIALACAVLVYGAVLYRLRLFSPDEAARLQPLLPARLRRAGTVAGD